MKGLLVIKNIDEKTQALGQTVARRQTSRKFGTLLAAGVFASFGIRSASAQVPSSGYCMVQFNTRTGQVTYSGSCLNTGTCQIITCPQCPPAGTAYKGHSLANAYCAPYTYAIDTDATCACFSQQWILTSAPTNEWACVASSADGSKLVAGSYYHFSGNGLGDGLIYRSTNGGASWFQTTAPAANWQAVVCSADGVQIAAAINGDGRVDGGPIYISRNSGATWTKTTAPPSPPAWGPSPGGLTCSADGAKLLAGQNSDPGPTLISTDSGVTWMQTSLPTTNFWVWVACSADGSALIAAPGGADALYVSTNGGAAWAATATSLSDNWASVACSANGTRIAAAGYTSGGVARIYLSTDSGATWTNAGAPQEGTLGWPLACSADGFTLVSIGYNAAASLPMIYRSTTFGTTWSDTQAPNVYEWEAVACSADAAKIIAVAWNGGIYTWQSASAPSLNIARSGTNAVLSWIVPSTNFNLQQASDLSAPNWANVPAAPGLNFTNLRYELVTPLRSEEHTSELQSHS